MNKKLLIVLYTLLHLLVDGICAYTIINNLYIHHYRNAFLIFVIYNTMAFCFQPIVGLIVDKLKCSKIIYKLLCGISVVVVIVGSISTSSFIVSCLLLGFGNSLFHVVGGKVTAQQSNNKLLPLGLFVSLGALGIFLGTNIVNSLLISIFRILSVIIVIFIIIFKNKYNYIEQNSIIIINKKTRLIISILLISAIVFRSFVGEILFKDMLITFNDYLILTICICLGKIFGGLLVDKFGIKVPLILSMVLFIIICSILPHKKIGLYIGILCFNMSMPITLHIALGIFGKNKAFAFGLLAAFIFPAYILGQKFSLLIQQDIGNYILVIVLLGLLNIICVRASDIKWLKR